MSFLKKDALVWYNGQWVLAQDANISVMSHGLHYGSGVFEGVRSYPIEKGSAIFRLADHTKRLFNSAKLLNIGIPFEYDVIFDAQKALLVHNKLSAAYIRPLVFYGDASLGVYPIHKQDVNVAIAAWPWENYFNVQTNSVKVKISTFRRHNPNSILTKAKATGYYVNSLLALQEAKALGYHEAILMDSDGFIAEGSSSNIFIVKDNVLYTPPDAHILPGITRDTIFNIAKYTPIPLIEKNMTRNDLYLADEAFLVGTAVELMPITQVDQISINQGMVGPIAMHLKNEYHQMTRGKNDLYQHWVTPILYEKQRTEPITEAEIG